jgi:hypothetical protein
LLSLLRLDSAYVRFDDPDGGPAIEDWRPQGPAPPAELVPCTHANDVILGTFSHAG